MECPKLKFLNKIVLITGASSGIGAATAVHFASLGAVLVLAGRNQENLKQIKEKCLEVAPKGSCQTLRPLLLIGELTDDDNVRMIIEKTIEKFDRIDVLINNAGTHKKKLYDNKSFCVMVFFRYFRNGFDRNLICGAIRSNIQHECTINLPFNDPRCSAFD